MIKDLCRDCKPVYYKLSRTKPSSKTSSKKYVNAYTVCHDCKNKLQSKLCDVCSRAHRRVCSRRQHSKRTRQLRKRTKISTAKARARYRNKVNAAVYLARSPKSKGANKATTSYINKVNAALTLSRSPKSKGASKATIYRKAKDMYTRYHLTPKSGSRILNIAHRYSLRHNGTVCRNLFTENDAPASAPESDSDQQVEFAAQVWSTYTDKNDSKSAESYKILNCLTGFVKAPHHSINKISRKFKISKPKAKQFKKGEAMRKETLKALSRELKASIKDFYHSGEISRVDPTVKKVTKAGPTQYMFFSQIVTYQTFKDDPTNKEITISFSAFKKLKPKNIKTVCQIPHNTCLCVYCMNVYHKVNALLGVSPKTTKSEKPTNEHELFKSILCPKEPRTLHKAACINKTCTSCLDWSGTIKKIYADIPKTVNPDIPKTVNYIVWENESYVRERDGETCTRRVHNPKVSTVEDCIDSLIDDIMPPNKGKSKQIPFIEHLFTAKYQTKQFYECKENLKVGEALIIQDFSKNRELYYQDEIKSAYWSKGQVSMHPSVCFVKLKEDEDPTRTVIVHLSDLKDHNAHLVDYITHDTIKILKQKYPEINFTKFYLWSDGCASQYKGKNTFYHLTEAQSLHIIERNYFCSEHGKNESDAETALINKKLNLAILSRQVVISNACDMYNYLSTYQALALPYSSSKKNKSERIYKLVLTDDVPSFDKEVDTLSNTMSRRLHQIYGLRQTSTEGILRCRDLSCFCKFCTSGVINSPACINKDYTGKYTRASVAFKPLSLRAAQPDTIRKANTTKLICIGPDIPIVDCHIGEFVLIKFAEEKSKKKDNKRLVGLIKATKSDTLIVRKLKKHPLGWDMWRDDRQDEDMVFHPKQVVLVLPKPQLKNGLWKFSYQLTGAIPK